MVGANLTMKRPHSLNAIKSLRLSKLPTPWRQLDLALRIGCRQDHISEYERGRRLPDIHTAMTIAQALGKHVEEVFWEMGEHVAHEIGERLRQQNDDDNQAT